MIDWQKLETLFSRMDQDTMLSLPGSDLEHVYDKEWPSREWEERFQTNGIGYDIVYKAGPHDWSLPGAGKKTGIENRQQMLNDSVVRKKIYLREFQVPQVTLDVLPELDYFVQIREQFLPAVTEYTQHFQDQTDIEQYVFQLMLIEYSNSFIPSNSTVDEYWSWNFEKFGLPHCDESLGGLHLGENLEGFYIDKSDKRVYYDLTKDDTVWFWGQEAAASGCEPTVHGVEYLNNSNGKNRYSVIFNLKTKRK